MEKIQAMLNAYSMTQIIDHPRSLASVLQETKAFHETPLDAPKCCRLITELVYLICQGSRIGSTEQNDLFFAFMKLFQSQNVRLRRMVYLLLKDISEGSTSVFMVTNCLSKDMQSKNESYRANAIRGARILDSGTVAQIDRYLKAAVVDRSPFVASAALVCGVSLIPQVPEMIKRWVNEASDALNSKNAMVQYHALNLMYELKRQDRLALQKLVCNFASGQQGGPVGTRSPHTECLLIGFAVNMILTDREPQIDRVLLGFVESCLRNKSEIVTFEAARALCLLAVVETDQSGSRKLNANSTVAFGIDFVHATTILQIGLGSSKPVNRLAALRTLNSLSKSRPGIVARCNVDIEPLLTDQNRNIATLALTVLLKTAQEGSVDKLVGQIGSFMNDLTDIYKLDVVSAVHSLCEAYPAKYKVLLSFLDSALREEGTLEVKRAIADAIISIINAIPAAMESGLSHLCEFIEDCEFPNLSCSILSFLTENAPKAASPGKYVRFIYNRLILENATVRAAAVESLTRIALARPELADNIRVLLETASTDTDDDVRDRVNFYMTASTTGSSDCDDLDCIFNDEPAYSVDALYDALEIHMADAKTAAMPFDISRVPDEKTYVAELRVKEAAAAAEAAAAIAAVEKSTRTATVNVPSQASVSSGVAVSANSFMRPEFVAAMAAIMDPSQLGPLQHVCRPEALTELEAEYTVQAVKHMFGGYLVLEFFVSNTVDGVILANVHIKLGNVDPQIWHEVGSISIPSLAFGESKSAYTVLAKHKASASCNFPASLYFMQREDGDPVGFPDDFPIEPVKLIPSDYIVARSLPVGQFPHAWDSLGPTYEKVQKYALNHRSLEATVAGLLKTLNMAACEGTDRLEMGVQKPTLLLAGNFVGNVPVLAQAVLYIHPQRGCMIQLTSRGGTSEAAETVHRAIE